MLVQDGGFVSAYFCGEQKKKNFIHNFLVPLTREVKAIQTHLFAEITKFNFLTPIRRKSLEIIIKEEKTTTRKLRQILFLFLLSFRYVSSRNSHNCYI